MQKLDKVFAGLILITMAVFWIAISPAGIASKTSEAMPVTVSIDPDTPAAETKRKRNRPMTEAQKRRRDARKVDAALVERLSRRKRDTPANGAALMREGLAHPAVRPNERDREDLLRFDTPPNQPVFN